MTQPLDVAYVEIKPDLKDFSRDARREINHAYSDIEKDSNAAAKRIEESFKGASQNIGNLFRDQNGRLRDQLGRFARIGDVAGEAFSTASRGANAFASSLTQVGSILFGMLGSIGQLAATGPVGIALLAAAFVALAAAAAAAAAVIQNLIIIVGFGIASLPGLIAGAVAGFGILAVALNGVTEAFQEQSKAATSAGGAVVNSERQIAAAQRNVIEQQRQLNKAREEAKERIDDIRIALDRSRVSELRASKNLRDAQIALAQARAFGTQDDVREAEVALAEQQQALIDAKENTSDLTKENEKAAKVGVEGDEQVIRAKLALLAAQDALVASQQKFSAGAAAQNQAFNNLSKNAQSFVLALVEAKKQLAPVADAIQNAFFAGSASLIQPIVDNIKELQPQLVKVAAGFGRIFNKILEFLGSDEAKNAASSILEGLSAFLTAVEPAVKPLLEAFASLIGDSGEFGDNLGGAVATGLTKLANFVKDIDLKQLFEDAKVALNEVLPLFKSLVSIGIDLFKILADVGSIVLPAIVLDLKILAAVVDFAKGAWDRFIIVVKEVWTWLGTNIPKAFSAVTTGIKNILTSIGNLGTQFLNAGKNLITKFFEGMGAAGGYLSNIGKKIANSVVGFINSSVISNLNSAVNFLENTLNNLPFFDVNLPTIPRVPALEKGGILTKEGMFIGGEKGRREGVIPLEDPKAMREIGQAISKAGGTNAAATSSNAITFAAGAIVLNFEGAAPSQAVAKATGEAVGQGIAEVLARRGVRMQIRTL